MYDKGALEKISKYLNKPIDEILDIYKDSILFAPHKNDPKLGAVLKECKGSDIKFHDIITVREAEYIKFSDYEILGITSDLLNITKTNMTIQKEEETKKEAKGHDIAKAVKMVAEWFEIDPDYAMQKLRFANEKIKMKNKLIGLGYETKKQRKYIHDAIKYCNRNIKRLGMQGAVEDTAEKYKLEVKLIKHIRGFQNSLFANPFK